MNYVKPAKNTAQEPQTQYTDVVENASKTKEEEAQ